MNAWFAYILECADGTLYSGITTDLSRRVEEHNGKVPGGARYTRSRRPVTLRYAEQCVSRSQAAVAEAALKRLPREEKLALIKRKAGNE